MRRTKMWRERAANYCRWEGFPRPLEGDGWVVTITLRASRGPAVDSDNLQGLLKNCRDGVADALGRGDSPRDGIRWAYKWIRGPDSVLIELSKEA